MNSLKLHLFISYVFLGLVAASSIDNIWMLQTNPFASYLGGYQWFYLAVDTSAIVASGLAARALLHRLGSGPRLLAIIAWAVLVAYLGGNVLIYILVPSTPLRSVLSVMAASVSLLAIATLILLRTREFVSGYARGANKA
jgi:hypothetical protein